ncbi:MAG: flagellar biosynthesis protein FlhB [Oscillospiraceae bacterium]|nr:flagellar biosynthesis protein FlhB [Oscillospiraceae bacterium]
MAQNESGSEKTEKASPKKRADERKKGNIFVSKDITTVVSLVASFFILSFFIGGFLDRVQEIYRLQMQRLEYVTTLEPFLLMQLYRDLILTIVTTLLPAMLLISAVTIAIVMTQTKLLFATENLKFKGERLNPIKGLKRLFSLRSIVELAKSLIKISALAYILYVNISTVVDDMPLMIDWELGQAITYTGQRLLMLVAWVGVVFAGVAALDYLYQRYEYEKNIKMTKQEVKDEYKQMEGNPEVKSARRQKQREYAMGRMMQSVGEADVVVRNPTHYAVALKYKLDEDVAPVVLAKGKDLIAQKIVEEAEAHGVATVENKSLARGLYESAAIDAAIPGEFFQPVAELLAWLYSQQAAKKEKS